MSQPAVGNCLSCGALIVKQQQEVLSLHEQHSDIGKNLFPLFKHSSATLCPCNV